MSCAHQHDEDQKGALKKMKGKINGKYNMISYFIFFTVECILQHEGQKPPGKLCRYRQPWKI
jgi:hypothetical protein